MIMIIIWRRTGFGVMGGVFIYLTIIIIIIHLIYFTWGWRNVIKFHFIIKYNIYFSTEKEERVTTSVILYSNCLFFLAVCMYKIFIWMSNNNINYSVMIHVQSSSYTCIDSRWMYTYINTARPLSTVEFLFISITTSSVWNCLSQIISAWQMKWKEMSPISNHFISIIIQALK